MLYLYQCTDVTPPPHSLVYISTEKKMFLINVQRILNKFRKWNTFEFPVSSKLL